MQATITPTATGTATYCPEDDKLRLYVGRVPRDEYEFLRAQGWTSTPKQDCDFVAVWTPEREDTALAYSDGLLDDEDQSPQDRAADRAERFAGYREKRTDEATGQADRYETAPQIHGHQSAALAERRAAQHDRIGTRAVNLWGKAEYWQQRTAGVISHALYVSGPGVRMGRIKVLEADIRRLERDGNNGRWLDHYRLRLAYENQMLEAQGGRAAFVEMEAGGWIGKHQIQKVNKSSVTGRVVSVAVKCPRFEGWQYGSRNVPGTDYALMTIETERLKADVYRAPTDDERATFTEAKKEAKNARKDEPKGPSLINPTIEDAERLQAALNASAKADKEARQIKAYGKIYDDYKPSTVLHMTQAEYSEASKGAYSHFETRGLCRNCQPEPRKTNMWRSGEKEEAEKRGPALCKIRLAGGNGSDYGARRVVVLTDKPGKPFPDGVFSTEPQESEQKELAI